MAKVVGRTENGQWVGEPCPEGKNKLAEMFASQQPPGCMTDSVFMEGRCNGNQFEKYPHIGDWYKAQATKAGVDTTGKYYSSGLAAFPGDPKAWISGRGDVQRLCEERGWNCNGAVEVKAPALDEAPVSGLEGGLDPDLVTDIVEEKIAAQPELARVDQGELRHEVVQSIKPHWVE